MKRLFCFALVGLFLGMTAACERCNHSEEATQSAAPASITTEECAACGMVVREQPAPRAQLVHRDGTRAAFCSLSDLAHYMQAPSPHGKVEHVFVEVLAPSEDPTATDTTFHPWVAAEDAVYVLGVKRPGIMGPPVLAYRSAADARAVAEQYGERVLGFAELRRDVIEPSGHEEARHEAH